MSPKSRHLILGFYFVECINFAMTTLLANLFLQKILSILPPVILRCAHRTSLDLFNLPKCGKMWCARKLERQSVTTFRGLLKSFGSVLNIQVLETVWKFWLCTLTIYLPSTPPPSTPPLLGKQWAPNVSAEAGCFKMSSQVDNEKWNELMKHLYSFPCHMWYS